MGYETNPASYKELDPTAVRGWKGQLVSVRRKGGVELYLELLIPTKQQLQRLEADRAVCTRFAKWKAEALQRAQNHYDEEWTPQTVRIFHIGPPESEEMNKTASASANPRSTLTHSAHTSMMCKLAHA
ncbi:hypothetical protein M8818_005134 [Zalaria obscura]|uniref:Uncharacterized protein n=1 Tax=Zalaria obscura TaxID=2024903 RepID=A0ACC3S9V4_9PEZI